MEATIRSFWPLINTCSLRVSNRTSRVSLRSIILPLRIRASSSSSPPSIQQLPTSLRSIVNLFEGVVNPKDRYEQLLHYAKKLQPLAEEHHTTENKVTGCVSQVWVRAFLGPDQKVYFEADSDSILTKGLAALLVQGLSGCTASEILMVRPEFIQSLGLQQSLTPSRNNGFFNMFKLMQQKALKLYASKDGESSSSEGGASPGSEVTMVKVEASEGTEDSERSETTMVNGAGESSTTTVKPPSRSEAIERKLREALSPTLLKVQDVSHEHAGHAAMRHASGGGETHFNIKVVSPEFEGRSLVKRHRLIYELLDEELKSGLHALSIVAKTPSEEIK